MSKISKYLQLSDKLLLEYIYDNNPSITNTVSKEAYVLLGLDDKLMYLENPKTNNISTDFSKGFMYSGFPNDKGDNYFYPGYLLIQDNENAVNSNIGNNLVNTHKIKSVLAHQEIEIPYDIVRIHILTGYTFNDSIGFMLSVRAFQSQNSIISSAGNTVTLRNFVFHKGNASKVIKFEKQPFYMQSKFYDRYIELQVPSGRYLANNKNSLDSKGILDYLNVQDGNLTIFDFCNIDNDSFTGIDRNSPDYVSLYKNGYIATGYSLYDQGTFIVNNPATAEISLNSNADKFNIRLYEDTTSKCIRYYPVWGDVINNIPISINIMNNLENGTIQLSSSAFMEENNGDIDTFEKIYGLDARKWIIVNQLTFEFNYHPLIESEDDTDSDILRTQKFSMTEDFNDDYDNILNVDDLYKFYYKPVVQSMSGYICNFIIVTYTARLVNRLNGEEVIRRASITIEDAESKYGMFSQQLNVSNIYKWKLFNKIETTQPVINTNSNTKKNTKYITKYYSNNAFVIKDENGIARNQGNYNIALYDTDHIYKIQLFKNESMSEVYQLDQINATYLLEFTDSTGASIQLKPQYTEDISATQGELAYKISANNAKKILDGDRKFAIIAQTASGNTTLFAGTFSSIYD